MLLKLFATVSDNANSGIFYDSNSNDNALTILYFINKLIIQENPVSNQRLLTAHLH